jgi:hypothetical protein
MIKDYKKLTESVKYRVNPENLILEKAFRDELSSLSYSDVLVFIRTAMKGVEPEYTRKSKEAGERAKEHLEKGLNSVVYRYQGSVMSDTHIKGYSDIDLLTISDKFYGWDSSNVNEVLNSPERRNKFYESSIKKLQEEVNISSYQGDSLADLRKIRLDSEAILKPIYTICDTSQPKAIKIKNLNLNRDVDIVTANWYDDVTSIINEKGEYRGVQVYDKDNHKKISADFPFLSIKRINDRGSATNGRLKRMIRFLKNCKVLSDYKIDLSSFDINAICYDIDITKYQYASFYELVPILYKQLKSICENTQHANDLVSVDDREYIFRYNTQKINNLRILLSEVEGIYNDLNLRPIL